MNTFIYYIVAPFFIINGFYVIVRSVIGIRKDFLKTGKLGFDSKNKFVSDAEVGFIILTIGIMTVLKIIKLP